MSVSFLPGLLAGIISGVAFAVSLRIFVQVVLAQRAKHRAHRLIVERASTDAELERLLRTAADRHLSSRELELALRAIEAELSALSAQDRSFVAEGLRQPSASGAKRYVNEVFAGVAA